MKTKMRLLMILAVCAALTIPCAAFAEEAKEVGRVKLGPGNHNLALGMEVGAKSLFISVVNGTGATREKITSAVIEVNDKEIYGPNDFSAGKAEKAGIRALDVTREMDEVKLVVEAKGKKGAEITLTITGVYDEVVPTPIIVPYFMDGDGDGIGGDISVLAEQGNPPPGPWVPVGGDPDDTNPLIF